MRSSTNTAVSLKLVLGAAVFSQVFVCLRLHLHLHVNVGHSSWDIVHDASRALTLPVAQQSPAQHPDSQGSFIMLNETFSYNCRKSKLYNRTWGLPRSKFVDKYATKFWVESVAEQSGVRVVPTLAMYDSTNISSFTTDSLIHVSKSRNLILKPTHAWARTARVWNQTYNCYRHCEIDGDTAISITDEPERAHQVAYANLRFAMERLPVGDYTKRETQYQDLPKRVIVEEHLDRNMQEYHWWVVHGQPVFVCARCDTADEKRGSYFTTDFRTLSIQSAVTPCEANITQPSTWNQMVAIVKRLGSHIPGIVSIDLYANQTDVFFSEFTFTRSTCATPFRPWVADHLLHKMETRHIEPTAATSDFVYKLIEDRSWVWVEWDLHHDWSWTAFPSAVDLCYSKTMRKKRDCLDKANYLVEQGSDQLQCVLSKKSRPQKRPAGLLMIGLTRGLSLEGVIDRIDWPWALFAFAVWIVLARRNDKSHKAGAVGGMQCWRLSCLVYLIGVALYKSLQTNFEAWWDPSATFVSTVTKSFDVFTIVHPVTSTAVCLSHFTTYWLPIAAVRASLRRGGTSRMLLAWIGYELLTAAVNEYAHAEEPEDAVRCTRVAYISHAKQYVWNDIIRAYLLPPLFVYGYLLPKFLYHYCSSIL